jgi:hypothetical protein
LKELRQRFTKSLVGLLHSLYPFRGDNYPEGLTDEQLLHFNQVKSALVRLLELHHIKPSLIDIAYDGTDMPLPFPDAHWDLVTIWSLVDNTLPAPIILRDGTTIDYTAIILRDPTARQRWAKRLDYARKGFRFR